MFIRVGGGQGEWQGLCSQRTLSAKPPQVDVGAPEQFQTEERLDLSPRSLSSAQLIIC